MARGNKDIDALLGGGSGKLPRWARAVGFALVIGLAWVLAWEMGLFLILLASGGYVIWSWFREKGNVVDSLANWVFFVALLATALAAPLNATADGMKAFGPAVWGAVVQRWNEKGSTPGIQITPAETTTTTAPPEAAQGPR